MQKLESHTANQGNDYTYDANGILLSMQQWQPFSTSAAIPLKL
jgi:hypothetical protein